MIPDKTKGWAFLIFQYSAKDLGLAPGDNILCEVEVMADVDMPMDMRLNLTIPGQKEPVVNLGLPYTGEGIWRTLRMAVTVPAGDLEIFDFRVRVRGAKPGCVVYLRRASMMRLSPV